VGDKRWNAQFFGKDKEVLPVGDDKAIGRDSAPPDVVIGADGQHSYISPAAKRALCAYFHVPGKVSLLMPFAQVVDDVGSIDVPHIDFGGILVTYAASVNPPPPLVGRVELQMVRITADGYTDTFGAALHRGRLFASVWEDKSE